MQGPTNWHSRPVFISSTFRDMHAERDYLRHKVFPVLEERLKERAHHLEPIDLRWGVETRSASDREEKEQLVLKVCLGEIERSRPFLVVLLGDRYGWVPPEDRVRATAQEAGYDGALVGKSVTALEIEFGILASAEQRKRCRFYFREPLPYELMDRATAAQYSDGHSTDPDVRTHAAKLGRLKLEIEAAVQQWGMPERVRRYSAQWNRERGCVAGLEAWGDQVIEDVWSDLEVETRGFVNQPAGTWQEQERRALEEFVELGCRDFRGREELLDQLEAFATAATVPDAPWGVCLHGPAGSGKSALVSMLSRRLQGKALVLFHAAGISERSTDVDALLRRFIGELAQFHGEPDPAPDLTTLDDLRAAFADSLRRASHPTRVVCLVDGLNQFARTTAAMYLTWLPKPWPDSARWIATTLPGVESEALGQRSGIETRRLAVLDGREATEITNALCSRYHKTLHPEIRDALLSKRLPDGTPATGNPLWLALAVEELLLLDADDFARAERSFAGSPEERLHGLLLDTAERLPADVESLYGYLLRRNEQIHGARWARAFAVLIAVSRNGLRETDLEALLPGEVGEPWNPLRFASLRRSFRAHLVRRGAALQWDFFHAQMRTAVGRTYLAHAGERRRLHTALADRLERLPPEDSLRQAELMYHYIGANDHLRAAGCYRDLAPSTEALASATRALAAHVLAGGPTIPNDNLEWVCQLTSQIKTLLGLDLQTAHVAFDSAAARFGAASLVAVPLCWRLMHVLGDVLENEAQLGVREHLFDAVRKALTDLAAESPHNVDLLEAIAQHGMKAGDVLRDQGRVAAALGAYREALRLFDDPVVPPKARWQASRATALNRVGDALLVMGNLSRALEAHEESLHVTQGLVTDHPEERTWRRELAASHEGVGRVRLAMRDLDGALAAFQEVSRTMELLAANDPGNAGWQHDLSVSRERVGAVLEARGEVDTAIAEYRASIRISERLAGTDPTVRIWQRQLSACHAHVGNLLLLKGDAEGAMTDYRETLRICRQLAVLDPTHLEWQIGVAVGQEGVGKAHMAAGDLDGALAAYREALGVHERLFSSDSSVANGRSVTAEKERIGDVLLLQGRGLDALSEYEAAAAIAAPFVAAHPRDESFFRDSQRLRSKAADLSAAFAGSDLEAEGLAKLGIRLLEGNIDLGRRILEKAVSSLQDSLETGRRGAQIRGLLAQASLALSAAYGRAGRNEEARQSWGQAWSGIEALRRSGTVLDPELVSMARSMIAGPCQLLEEESVRARRAGDSRRLLESLKARANLWWLAGDSTEAVALLRELGQCCRDTGDAGELQRSLVLLGERLLRDLRQPQAAVAPLEEALALARARSDSSLEWRIRGLLDSARAFGGSGNQ